MQMCESTSQNGHEKSIKKAKRSSQLLTEKVIFLKQQNWQQMQKRETIEYI